MREIKFRVYWSHQESDCFGFDYFDGYDGWREKDPLQEPVAFEQFTGLRDKNGKEIYEGDILSHRYYSKPVICTWADCGFITEDVSITDKSLEVIGNIHENPELLK